MNKKIKSLKNNPAASASSPAPQSCLGQTQTAPSNKIPPIYTSSNILPGPIYAPYIPIYNTAGDYTLNVQLLVPKDCYMSIDVYEESIKLLNKMLASQIIPHIVDWDLDELRPFVNNSIKLSFCLFKKDLVFINSDPEPVRCLPRNSMIQYHLRVSLLYSLSKSNISISDIFKKYYNDNYRLKIYLKGSMTVAKKEIIKEIPDPHDPLGKPWKVYSKENFIKKITPEWLEAYEGSRKLEI